MNKFMAIHLIKLINNAQGCNLREAWVILHEIRRIAAVNLNIALELEKKENGETYPLDPGVAQCAKPEFRPTTQG